MHDALLAGDVTASERLAEALLPALQRRFAGRRELDPHETNSLIGRSIAAYVAGPGKYDPDRAPLLAYLYRDIDGDIRNEIAKLARRPETPREDERLEVRASGGNPEEDVLHQLDPLDLPRETVEAALHEFEALSEEERQFLRLRADGVRATHVYAEGLGIAHLPDAQQRRAVKRAKDRLDKRLERIRDRLSR